MGLAWDIRSLTAFLLLSLQGDCCWNPTVRRSYFFNTNTDPRVPLGGPQTVTYTVEFRPCWRYHHGFHTLRCVGPWVLTLIC